VSEQKITPDFLKNEALKYCRLGEELEMLRMAISDTSISEDHGSQNKKEFINAHVKREKRSSSSEKTSVNPEYDTAWPALSSLKK
jgi:hypothetical protein